MLYKPLRHLFVVTMGTKLYFLRQQIYVTFGVGRSASAAKGFYCVDIGSYSYSNDPFLKSLTDCDTTVPDYLICSLCPDTVFYMPEALTFSLV